MAMGWARGRVIAYRHFLISYQT